MKKILMLVGMFALVGLAYISFSDFDKKNDVIYFGGNIITMEDNNPTTKAIYIKDGIIVAVGKKDSLLQLKSANTRLVDLGDKTLMPGFIDPHGHYDLAAVFKSMTDVSGILYRKPDEVWKRINAAISAAPRGKWVYIYGMDPILTEGIQTPTLKYLDSISPHNPIVIITKALHVFYANSKAFEDLGISKNTVNPSEASYYEKDEIGNLTGAIIEQEALEPFRQQIQADVMAKFVPNTQAVMQDYAAMGVTTAVNMGLSADKKSILSLYQHLAAEKSKPLLNIFAWLGKLPKRGPHIRLLLYLRKENIELLPNKNEKSDDFFHIKGIKMWYDGSPYSGSMYLRQPYVRSAFTINGINLNPAHRSHSLLKPTELSTWIKKVQDMGYPTSIHAQGDIANDEVIKVLSELHAVADIRPFRHRLEHCMLLPKERLDAIKAMSVSPGFHINHVLYYGDFLNREILGEKRIRRIFPIKSTVDVGLPFSLHADMPQFIPNPLELANTAINRKTESGHIYNEDEKIAVWDALKGITSHAAWQLHMEEKLGSIAVGKYADLVILDQNPQKIAASQLSKVSVLETIVAGNTVFSKK